MPSDIFVDELAAESAAWESEGIVTPEQAGAIRARYPAIASRPAAAESATTQVLYATAGVLIGAAALALVVVGLERENALTMTLAGLVLLAGGIGLHFALPERRLLSDALLVGSLLPIVIASFRDDPVLWRLLGVAVPLALIVWRRDRGFVQSLGVIGFSAGAATLSGDILDPLGSLPWAISQAALLAGIVTMDRAWRKEDNVMAAAFAAIALAISCAVYFAKQYTWTSTTVEIALGAVLLVVMAAAVSIRHRGVVIGTGAALGVDAIVFAFEFGGVLTGTLVLLGIAALLIVQAEALRRYLGTQQRVRS